MGQSSRGRRYLRQRYGARKVENPSRIVLETALLPGRCAGQWNSEKCGRERTAWPTSRRVLWGERKFRRISTLPRHPSTFVLYGNYVYIIFGTYQLFLHDRPRFFSSTWIEVRSPSFRDAMAIRIFSRIDQWRTGSVVYIYIYMRSVSFLLSIEVEERWKDRC